MRPIWSIPFYMEFDFSLPFATFKYMAKKKKNMAKKTQQQLLTVILLGLVYVNKIT